MSMKTPPFKPGDDERITIGLALLRKARDEFSLAGARKTAAKVRRAISSALGARRNVETRRRRAQRAS